MPSIFYGVECFNKPIPIYLSYAIDRTFLFIFNTNNIYLPLQNKKETKRNNFANIDAETQT